ncbi:hypothetical protein [Microbacterium luteum]|uniref:hypothetical protein n=1 Tax=Microbacterium luteum TaxID=2782167 RepID=UPI001888F6DD|nr:hypothetical protein [Microbacterium luteum]
MEEPAPRDRIKFYGPGDLANYLIAEEAVALLRAQPEAGRIASLNEALEIHNALEFERHDILPSALTPEERATLGLRATSLRGQLAGFFATIDDTNVAERLAVFDREYVHDLLHLINRFKIVSNVGGQRLFDALVSAGVPLWAMLADKSFVKGHDGRLRTMLLSDARYGELLVNARLLRSGSSASFLPESLSADDSQQILKDYIDSESPHLNYIEAIANAHDNAGIGLTPKVRLAAQRRLIELTQVLFADRSNVVSGVSYAVGIDPDQEEPLRDRVERTGARRLHQRTFGGRYLKSSMGRDQILANFTTIIGYMDERGLLALPSFRSEIGVLEGLRVTGADTYPRGAAYRHRDSLTILSTEAYYDFLLQEGTKVEDVIAWYFRDYIAEVFGIAGFDFAPSTASGTFLERCRHLCAEMESIAKQFALYCEDGEIDRELLEMTSAPRPWEKIPSLVKRKYLLKGENEDCDTALRLLFSDQARINFINSDLRAPSFVQLVLDNHVNYESLHHYQTGPVDWLASVGLVSVEDGTVGFRSLPKIRVLRDINTYEAAPFGHYQREVAAAEDLAGQGWLDFGSTLLSPAEASYFNFVLNKSEFTDGHDLRNRYLHGTNPNARDEKAHREAYMQLLRLTLALLLKIQDDFALHSGAAGDASRARAA